MIQSVSGKQLTQADPARRLGLGVQWVNRLVRRYLQSGVIGLISARRGKRLNNALDPGVRDAIMILCENGMSTMGPCWPARNCWRCITTPFR